MRERDELGVRPRVLQPPLVRQSCARRDALVGVVSQELLEEVEPERCRRSARDFGLKPVPEAVGTCAVIDSSAKS